MIAIIRYPIIAAITCAMTGFSGILPARVHESMAPIFAAKANDGAGEKILVAIEHSPVAKDFARKRAKRGEDAKGGGKGRDGKPEADTRGKDAKGSARNSGNEKK